MRYIPWFKGAVFIVFACSFAAFGSTADTSSTGKSLSDIRNAAIGNITVAAGQTHNYQSSANLTISGTNSPVTVEKKGVITLSAGKSIVFLPGTKISAGSFLYASIKPVAKNRKHQKKESRLVTIEENEKIEEQASLSIAATLLSPFPTRSRGHLHAGNAYQSRFTASGNELSGVSPEQQRKMDFERYLLPRVHFQQILTSLLPVPATLACRAETTMVLRL